MGASAQAIATRDASLSERWMSGVRPRRSDSGPSTRIVTASPAVVSESESVLWAGVTPKSAASSVNSAWVL